jgi:hypothetical protein
MMRPLTFSLSFACLLWSLVPAAAGGEGPAPNAEKRTEERCAVPTSIPEWGPAREVRDLDASWYGRRYGARPLIVRESHWEIPPGTARFTCFDFGNAKESRTFFDRLKVLATPEQMVLLRGRDVILVYLPMESFLREAAAKVGPVEEQFGPGKGFLDLDLPDSIFPEHGKLIRNPWESSVDQFEDQEERTPLMGVRRLMWQRGGSVWLEAIFLVPPKSQLLPELLKASLRFRSKANGHVVDFVAPEFLVELIGSDPKLVDEAATRIEKLHPAWKKHSGAQLSE